MNKKISVLSIEYAWEQAALRVLLLLVAVFACLYLYFVAVSVLNIVAEREADAQAGSLQSSIANLETRYLALSDEISSQSAQVFGLAPVSDTSYVYMPGNAAAASVPTHDNII